MAGAALAAAHMVFFFAGIGFLLSQESIYLEELGIIIRPSLEMTLTLPDLPVGPSVVTAKKSGKFRRGENNPFRWIYGRGEGSHEYLLLSVLQRQNMPSSGPHRRFVICADHSSN